MKVISLGWGVQSFGLAALSALGILPRVDAAIHADTGHERSETYEFAKKWTPWLEEHGVRVVTVKAKIAPYNFTASSIFVAAYSSGGNKANGQLKRECTERWKIAPIRRWLQANRGKEQVEQWIGISFDELERMKPSDVKYIVNTFPYLNLPDNFFPRVMRRSDIVRWLQENDLEVPVKSACVMCPYHDRATWREIQLSGNGDWQKALAVDEAIRHKRPGYTCYLTPKRKPLAECDFRSQEEHGQLTMWDAEECSGMCFL